MVEQVDLYWHVALPGQPIAVAVHLFTIGGSFPKDKDIPWVVIMLCLNCSVGPLGMRAEHLRNQLHEATWEDEPDGTNW